MQRLVPVLAISPFGTGAEHAHSLLDDEFFFDYLVERGREFEFHAPRFSCDRLGEKFPAQRHRLRVLPESDEGWGSAWRLARSVKVTDGANVVFFGYSEKRVAAFVLRHALTKFRLSLVATNNFSSRRVRVYGAQMRWFLRLVRSRLERLVVHTDYELSLVESLDAVARQRAFSKRHHLMLPAAHHAAARTQPRRPVVAFFGPVKSEKPLEPLSALIAADVDGRFDYAVYGVTEQMGRDLQAKASPQSRVSIHAGRMSHDAYAQAVASADLLLLTHNRDFEGKLSGNLCDCIAHQVVFLGSTIEPHLEYVRRFGEIGYLADMTRESWAQDFVRDFSQAELLQRRQRMLAAANSFTRAAIHEDLDRCFA